MSRTSDSRPRVLYHAISSYQLLEVLLHRLHVHPDAYALLILPDFITDKYPRYTRLRRFFDRVVLFPYTRIPHGNEAQIRADTARFARLLLPEGPDAFSAVYVAGAHFYFSLYLLESGVPFTMFEDAAGMLSRAEELRAALAAKFPLHAELAAKYGLLDGSHPGIGRVICLKRAQTRELVGTRVVDFSVEQALEGLSSKTRKRVIRLFLRRKIRTGAEAVLLTQQFSNQGVLGEKEQLRLYAGLRDGPLRGMRLLIKKHPDDPLSYEKVFPGAEVIRAAFPAELLPYVFKRKPERVYAWDSTACENLRDHFVICKLGGTPHGGQTDAAGGRFGLPDPDGGASAAEPPDP